MPCRLAPKPARCPRFRNSVPPNVYGMRLLPSLLTSAHSRLARPLLRPSPPDPPLRSRPKTRQPKPGDMIMPYTDFSASTSSATDTPPSVDDVQTQVQKGFAALQIVTASCHAVRNTILEPLVPKPDWFDGLNDNLTTAKTHAGNWIDTLAPDI